jgi:hypothetical protein
MNKYYAGIGSRETPEKLSSLIQDIAINLQLKGYKLNSGGAYGADTFFSNATEFKDIYLPWRNYNNKEGIVLSGDKLIEATDIAAHFHPNWEACKFSVRLLHARNVLIILGADLKTPVKFVICWTKDGKASGGTGLGMRIAQNYLIPIYNLKNEEDLVKLNKFLE